MVTPIHIITIGLGSAFLLGLLNRANINTKGVIMLVSLALMTLISGQWAVAFLSGGQPEPHIFTAGFMPPLSINLYMGQDEAFLTFFLNLLGFLSALYLWDRLKENGKGSMAVLIILFMALNVIVLTRDLFNLFVFLEVSGIATAGLIILDQKENAIVSGFKYMMATGIIAGVLLLGVIFTYYFSSSLNLDQIISSNPGAIKSGMVAAFLILAAVLLELKPFPANGWALDVYQSANPGVGAIMSAGVATSLYFVMIKVLPIAPQQWLLPVAIAGIITFFLSNLMGINQKNTRRMLGYSSIAQIGLLLFVLGGIGSSGNTRFIIITILGTHFFAKAGLFWISGIVNKSSNSDWSAIREKPLLILLSAVFILALIGLPPFPAFFGKWELIMNLGAAKHYGWIAMILAGSLLEGYYLLRWFGNVVRGKHKEGATAVDVPLLKIIPVSVFAVLMFLASFYSIRFMALDKIWFLIPMAFVIVLFFLDLLPGKIKNLILIAGLSFYTWEYATNILVPQNDILRMVFTAIFLLGGILFLIPGFAYKGKRTGMYPMMAFMFVGLAGLLRAETLLQFFIGWEIMTIGSYMLVLRGKNGRKPAFGFIMFSLLGAYLIMTGFSMAGGVTGSFETLAAAGPLAIALITAGFLIKIATIGVHIWLPGSYAEADDDVTPIISAILIKSGIFGLILLITHAGTSLLSQSGLFYAIGWIGALTAILGNVMAVFQEDVKKLLAYSSVGVLGYILFSFAMVSHLGWLSGIMYSLVHFLYKGLLFIAVAGVIYRTRTRKIYEMGGLIKKMPLSFIAVLIGIITLAGMPPLAGFAGKWMLYNAVVLKGWYIQGAMVFFAGIIAFLYSFKLIHNIFLGPLKDNLRQIKEAPFWIIMPQLVLIAVIMFLSVAPAYFLRPVGNWLGNVIPGEGLMWEGTTAATSLGYWNPTSIMIIVGGMFAVLLGMLLLFSRKAQKVEMFNIVYQAEQPDRPETTHYAFNMFAHYNKALGFLTMPLARKFWSAATESITAVGWQIRKIYSGNGQAYALHIIIFIVLFYLLSMGGF